MLPPLCHYVHNLDPFLWHWHGEWGIRYYGLAYIFAFLIAYLGLEWMRRHQRVPLRQGDAADLLFYLVLGTLIGGRLGYCFFYDLSTTLRDPISVIAFWSGGISGMSSHGGIVGIVTALILFCRNKNIAFWPVADSVALFAPIGIALGRVANFINGELWGRPSEVPWAVVFPQAPWVAGQMVPRHPSQLYQAFGEGLLLFILLACITAFRPRAGVVSASFFSGYAVARFIGEYFRQPDGHIGYLWGGMTMGQILSLLLIPFSIVIYFISRKQ